MFNLTDDISVLTLQITIALTSFKFFSFRKDVAYPVSRARVCAHARTHTHTVTFLHLSLPPSRIHSLCTLGWRPRAVVTLWCGNGPPTPLGKCKQ